MRSMRAPLREAIPSRSSLWIWTVTAYRRRVAFFRTTAVDNSPPLKIYIYHQTEEGQYAVQTIIRREGTAINSISYVDLDGTQARTGRPTESWW